MPKNLLLVVSGPSGVGKGTVVKELIKKGGRALSVSCTTRAPREGEIDGVSYFFITKEKFESLISSDGFLEYDNHFENYYGTPRAFVEDRLKSGDVILEIDVDGALRVKKSRPEAVLIFILPPDRDELVKRLRGRGTESEEKIQKRLLRLDYELSKKDLYDYTVINGALEKCVREIEEIIEKEKRYD